MPMREFDKTGQGRPEMPPIGLATEDDWPVMLSNIDDRVRESRDQSDEWNKKADANKIMYYAGENPAPSDEKIVFNRIRSDIKTAVNQQTREPADIKLKPVETNDPGEYYLFDQPTPGPIDEATATMLAQPQVTGEVDPMTGQPAVTPGARIFKLDDRMEADFWQRQFDVHFDRGLLWPAFVRCAFDAAIFGFKFPVFQFDQERKRCKLWTSISPWDTHTDSIGVDNFEESEFFGVDWLLPAGKAKQMFPEFADKIDQWARSGNPNKSKDVVLGGGKDRRYERNMIVLRHMWIRDQPILQTKNEVLQSGAFPVQQVATGEVMDDGMGGQIAATTDELAPDPETGEVPAPFTEDENGNRQISEDWPTRLTTRHLVSLPDVSVLCIDEECQYDDIPAAWHVGDPIPGQLFGTGYPESFRSPQMAENRMIRSVVRYVEQFPNPGAVIAEDVAQSIDRGLKGHMLRPSDILRVPSQYVERYGGADKVLSWNVPPPLAPAVSEVMQILQNKTRETAVNAEVSSGKAPGSVTGWQSLQLLQQAAANQYDFPMQWFTQMIARVSRIMLKALMKWLSTEDLMKVCSEYPPHIVEAFQRRALNSEWDIKVTLASVVGLQRTRDRQEAIEARQLVSPVTGRPAISDRTFAERLGENFDDENRRFDEEQASPAAQAMMMAKAQQSEQKNTESGKGESNGKAESNGFGGRMNGG